MSGLPGGAVTFLFTDIEGSTRLVKALRERYGQVLGEHRRLVRAAIAGHTGYEVDTQGDAFFVAFGSEKQAVLCALEIQRTLAAHQWPAGASVRVRIGIHTGHAVPGERGYTGLAVHRAARICAAAVGGQVLVSQATQTIIEDEEEEEPGFTLVDLGERTLKDLDRPVRLFQLAAPGLDTPARPVAGQSVGGAEPGGLAAATRVLPPDVVGSAGRQAGRAMSLTRAQLPVRLSPLVGRESELDHILQALGRNRLITLTGPGGTGKTRLALAAAGMAGASFPDGVGWVALAQIEDPGIVGPAAAGKLGVPDTPGQDPTEAIAKFLVGQQVLVVLDNCEHLTEAVADLAEYLLAACPALVLLATSREALGVEGELSWQVPPLSLPEAGAAPTAAALSTSDAIRLFEQRAQLVRPSFRITDENAATVLTICRRLDGLPLAIELAAARMRILSAAQLADRMDDIFALLVGGARSAPPRHQALRATLDWSHDLLDQDERACFRRLAVFFGGFTLAAAEHVAAGGGIRGDSMLDLLTRLADKSLLRVEYTRGETRYSLLATIRDYARERLVEAAESDQVQRAHLQYFTELVQVAASRIEQADISAGPLELELNRLDAELPNLRRAFEFAQETGVAVAGPPPAPARPGGGLALLLAAGGQAHLGHQGRDGVLAALRPASCRSAVIRGEPYVPLCRSNSRWISAFSCPRRTARGGSPRPDHL